jgi:hypothetical protein
MDDYVAYHSTELMGRDYQPGEQFHFFSRKPESILRRAIGNRVWVVVGKQDAARTSFRLAGVFTPSEVRPESDGFGISGPGKPFRPSPEVTAEAWFRSLLREQRNFSLGFNRIRSAVVAAQLQRYLSTNNPLGIHNICVYAIRHGDALDEDWRSGGASSFVEHRNWNRAAKELALATQNGSVLPVVFSDARATRDLIFRAQIDDIQLSSGDGNPQTTILASHLEKFAQPPRKTQLVLANTGARIPAGYIRSYAICRTPQWLYAAEALRPQVPPEMLDLPDPATEGRRKLVSHLIRERSRALIERKKRVVLQTAGRLACEVCGFDFRERYSILGDGFCEVHHRLALSDAESEVQTRLEDLAVVCANCHRMIHRGGEMRELSAVQAALAPNRPRPPPKAGAAHRHSVRRQRARS